MTEIDKLRDLIGKNEIEEVIRRLKVYSVGSNTLTPIIMQEGKWSKLKMDFINGVISREEEVLERNKIALSLLQIIDEIKSRSGHAKNTESVKGATSKVSRRKKIPYLVLVSIYIMRL